MLRKRSVSWPLIILLWDRPVSAMSCVELRKIGIFVSGGGVRSIWQRNNLETFKKRLKALEEYDS